MQSTRFSLNSIDWKSIGIGALKAILGALLTYVANAVIPFLPVTLWWVPVIVVVFSVVSNIGWKWIDGPAK